MLTRKKPIKETHVTKIPKIKTNLILDPHRELLPITENINENVMESHGAKGTEIMSVDGFTHIFLIKYKYLINLVNIGK